MQRTDMKTLRQILRYRHEFGVPQIRIAEALGVSTGGVSNLLARVRLAGLSWPLPEDLDDAALRALLYPPREPLPSDRHEPDWGSLAGQVGKKRKKRAPRVTRQLLWREHLEEAERPARPPTAAAAFSSGCPRNGRGPCRRTRWTCGSITNPGTTVSRTSPARRCPSRHGPAS